MIVVRYAYKEVFYTRVSRMDDNDTFYQTLSGIWLSYKKCYKYSFFYISILGDVYCYSKVTCRNVGLVMYITSINRQLYA